SPYTTLFRSNERRPGMIRHLDRAVDHLGERSAGVADEYGAPRSGITLESNVTPAVDRGSAEIRGEAPSAGCRIPCRNEHHQRPVRPCRIQGAREVCPEQYHDRASRVV